MLAVGEQASEFEGIGASGKTIRLSDYRGKKVLLFFLKDITGDYDTLNIYAAIDSAYEMLEALDIIAIGICPNSAKLLRTFYEGLPIYTPLLYDYRRMLARRYQVEKACVTFGKTYRTVYECAYIIDENGYIEKRYRTFKYQQCVKMVLNDVRKWERKQNKSAAH